MPAKMIVLTLNEVRELKIKIKIKIITNKDNINLKNGNKLL